MEDVKDYLLEEYLKWQRDLGKRGTVTAWAKFLDPDGSTLSRANLAALMRGDNTQPSMRVAYLFYEKTGNPKIMEVLGYPVPNAPLVDLPEAERLAILDWLESVKRALDEVPDNERMAKLKTILSELPDAETDIE
jgi:hypothetical protein